jgi:hypothetical protein
MKVLSIAFALATLVSSAPVGAQILGSRLPTGSGSVMVDGSWHAVGRDGNGNTIYERRTRDRNGNILVQRGVRDGNGNLRIVSSRTENDNRNDNRNQRNCDYNRSTNSIGDIIFGRTNDTYCEDVGNREDGGWYQVGRGRDNNSIYERRTYDRNGNLVIQRARRSSNGRMTIISTRRVNDNDKQWRKAQKRQDKEWKKDQKQQDKEYKKSGRDDNDDNRYYQNSSYQNDNRAYGQGKGNGKGNHKGKHKNKG